MKALSIALRVLLLAFLGWLYGGDVVRWLQAQGAEVTALSDLPRLWLGLLGTAVTVAGAVVLVQGRAQPASWKPKRLFTIGVLGLIFFDFVVLNSRRSPLTAEEQSVLAVQSVAEAANRMSAPEGVIRDPSLLQSFLSELGPVPFFVKGERVPAWKLELRERCQGPAADAREAEVGTVIYCVAPDRQRAWVTLVGTPLGQVFGPRAVVSTQQGFVGQVHAAPPEVDPSEEEQDPPVWDAPTPPNP